MAKKWLKKHGFTLIVDETTTAPGYRAMVVALAFQKRAIPLIKVSYEKNAKKGKRRPPQVKMIMYMLNTVKQVLPAGMTPLVITDRGLGNSPALCKAIKDMGWDYELRLPKNVKAGDLDSGDGRGAGAGQHSRKQRQSAQADTAFKQWLGRGEKPVQRRASLPGRRDPKAGETAETPLPRRPEADMKTCPVLSRINGVGS